MNKDPEELGIVELGVASEETRGSQDTGSEAGGRAFGLGGISDED